MHIKVYRHSLSWHPRGRHYAMHIEAPDGELLVDRTSDPAYAAARALVARGYTGPFEVCVPSASDPDEWIVSLRFKSARAAARLSAVERDRGRLMVIAYRPGPADRARSSTAEGVSMAAVRV